MCSFDLVLSIDSFDRPEEFLPERYLLSEHGTKLGANGDDFRASLPFGSGKVCQMLSPLALAEKYSYS